MNQTALWTFVDDDEDDDDDDTLANRTTEFVIDFACPDPATGRLPYRQVIEFTGGTGDFEDAKGGATILGTIDRVHLRPRRQHRRNPHLRQLTPTRPRAAQSVHEHAS